MKQRAFSIGIFLVVIGAVVGQTTVNAPGANQTKIYDISGENRIGEYWSGGASPAFLYDGAIWTTPQMPGGGDTFITGIDGENLVGYVQYTSVDKRGFLKTGASWLPLDAPPTADWAVNNTYALDIDGTSIVGYYEDDAHLGYGFLYDYSQDLWTTLTMPGAESTFIYGIDGDTLGGYYQDAVGTHGFIFDGTDWTTIDAPNATDTYVMGIQDELAVGYYLDQAGWYQGFWSDGQTFTTLSVPPPPGFLPTQTQIYGIEGNTVVGAWKTLGGNWNGLVWELDNLPVATPVPAPGALALGSAGFALFALLRRRRLI